MQRPSSNPGFLFFGPAFLHLHHTVPHFKDRWQSLSFDRLSACTTCGSDLSCLLMTVQHSQLSFRSKHPKQTIIKLLDARFQSLTWLESDIKQGGKKAKLLSHSLAALYGEWTHKPFILPAFAGTLGKAQISRMLTGLARLPAAGLQGPPVG